MEHGLRVVLEPVDAVALEAEIHDASNARLGVIRERSESGRVWGVYRCPDWMFQRVANKVVPTSSLEVRA